MRVKKSKRFHRSSTKFDSIKGGSSTPSNTTTHSRRLQPVGCTGSKDLLQSLANRPSNATPFKPVISASSKDKVVLQDVPNTIRFLRPRFNGLHHQHMTASTNTNAADRSGMALKCAQTLAVPQVPKFDAAIESSGDHAVPCPISVNRPHKANVSGESC